MASAYWVRLGGGLPATEIAPHSPPTWETLADGGIGEVSFEFAMSPKVQHQLLAAGVKVEVMLGAQAVATAEMTEPDRTTWAIKAQGYAAVARRLAALTPAGESTRDVGIALYTAIANGWWPITNPASVGAGKIVTGDSTSPQTMGQLLDELAAQEGKRWGVDGAGRLFLRSDPTAHTCVISPESAAFGVTNEGQATQLVGRYQSAADTFATRLYPATVTGPVIHEMIDEPLLRRGVLTAAQVDAILAGAFATGKAENRWTNGVVLSRDEVTRRGVAAVPANIIAGLDMARATGISDTTSSSPWRDVVLGKTRYTAGESTIYVEPVNKAPRGFGEVIAAT